MFASSKKLLESKDQNPIDDVMPYECWKLPAPIAKIVAGYAWDTPLQKPFLFSDVDYTLEKILFLAEYAGPLDQFELSVTRFIKRELANKAEESNLLNKIFTMGRRQGTLVQCLVIGMDQTIRKKDGTELDEGMAERLITIVKNLCDEKLLPPERLEEVKEQAGKAAPLEDKEIKAERESINRAAVNQLFDGLNKR